jgi:hypothetical protein
MKFKGTLLWAIVLIVLAVFVYLYEIKGGQRRQEEAEEAKKLLPVTTEEITELTLKRPQETVVCRRTDDVSTDDGWQIVEPLRTAGDRSAIETIIGTLAQAQTHRVIADTSADLAPFGLNPPQATVEVRSGEVLEGIIHLGHRNPTGDHIYARREGEPTVFLTATNLLLQAQKELFELRDRRVLTFQQPEVRGLALHRVAETIDILHEPEGWKLNKPLQVMADKTLVENMLRKLSSARVSAYIDESPEDLAPYGLDQPALSVTLTLGLEASQKTLSIGAQKDDQGRYARDASRDPVFLIPTDLYQELDQHAFDLRDKTVVAFDKGRAAELELRFDQVNIICHKDSSGQWHMAAPESTAADRWEVEALISSLAGLRAESFVDEDPVDLDRYGLTNPSLEAILRDETGQQLAALRLGKELDESVYACDADGAPVVLVDRSIVTSLSPDPGNLKKKEDGTP